MMASEKLVALADQRKLDAVVRVLGIEDSEDDPSEVCRQLLDSNEELRRSFNSILIDNSRLQERVRIAEDVYRTGRLLVVQLMAVITHLNGQAYSSTLSAMNDFCAAIDRDTADRANG